MGAQRLSPASRLVTRTDRDQTLPGQAGSVKIECKSRFAQGGAPTALPP